MAPKTFWLLDSLAAGANHLNAQDGGTTVGLVTGTGWTVGTTVAARYARMDAQVERAAAVFGATVEPSGGPDNTLGDCVRTPDPLTGVFVAGDWIMQLQVVAVTSETGQDGRVRSRLWKSADPTGAGATEITAAAAVSNIVSNITSVSVFFLDAIASLGQVILSNEYLFWQIAWEITGAATNVGADVLLRRGGHARLITPDFSLGVAGGAFLRKALFMNKDRRL